MAIVGIDLGTTNSLVSVWQDGKAVLIPNALGETLTPSVVGIDAKGEVVIGREARERLVTHADSTIGSFKRWMGTARETTLARGRVFRPEELSALILRSLKTDAEAFLGTEVKEAVISVPAYFNDLQRKATLDAGRLAGLKVERLINEPTAAALAYGLGEVSEGKFLVFDLGGGTFDVSILDKYEGVMEVRATAGDNFLGGNDFTEALTALAMRKLGKSYGDLSRPEQARVSRAAEAGKVGLSRARQSELTIRFDDGEQTVMLDRDEFEAECAPLLRRLRHPLERAIRDSSLRTQEIDQVVLVGGATRMPMIRALVTRLMGRLPLSNIDPDTTVCLGATVQSALKSRDAALEDVVMTDVCPYTLGIAVLDRRDRGGQMVVAPLLERNSTVPVSRSDQFFTVADKQAQIAVEVYQGENLRPSDNIYLGKIDVPVPVKPAGEEGIDVRFTYDINGALEVEVTVLSTKVKKVAIFQNTSGLSEAELKARFAALEGIKMPPREQAENKALIARAERLYAEATGDARQELRALITDFESEISRGDPRDWPDLRQRLTEMLNAVERMPILPE